MTLAVSRSRHPHSKGPALELVGPSKAIARANALLRRAAVADGAALLVAEPGVNAESVARELHARGRCPSAPFVAVDCARTAPNIDVTLFGASPVNPSLDLEAAASDGRLVAVRGGTLFLENVGELPASVQTKVARVARDGEAAVDGRVVSMTFRLVASATRDIDLDARERRFRPDLYRRLNASRVDLPPLRERLDDVPALSARILEHVCAARNLLPKRLTQAALALLSALSWPGNLAELESVLERAVNDAARDTIHLEHLLPALQLERPPAPFVPAGTLKDARLTFERDYIEAVLRHHGWRMSEAAQTLGIQRPNLYRKARQLGIPLSRDAE